MKIFEAIKQAIDDCYFFDSGHGTGDNKEQINEAKALVMIIENLQAGDIVLVNKNDKSEGTKIINLISYDGLLNGFPAFTGSDYKTYWNDGHNSFHSIRRKIMPK